MTWNIRCTIRRARSPGQAQRARRAYHPAMSAPPLCSVVIPAYQAESFLAQTIESVLAQTYPAVEVVIVNDGSTDGTAGVVGRFGDRVRSVEQENGGPSVARNTGI